MPGQVLRNPHAGINLSRCEDCRARVGANIHVSALLFSCSNFIVLVRRRLSTWKPTSRLRVLRVTTRTLMQIIGSPLWAPARWVGPEIWHQYTF